MQVIKKKFLILIFVITGNSDGELTILQQECN